VKNSVIRIRVCLQAYRNSLELPSALAAGPDLGAPTDFPAAVPLKKHKNAALSPRGKSRTGKAQLQNQIPATELLIFQIEDERLFVIFVGGFGGLLEFPAGLVNQLLGFGGMSSQVKLIGRLGSLDFFERHVEVPLRRSQVWVFLSTNVFNRRLHSIILRVPQTSEQQTNTQHTSQ
jgi:hypothetical protein